MSPTFEEGHWVASFRPSGWSRWVGATFLTVWLAMWAVGEAFSLAVLFALVASALSPGLWRAIGAPKFAALIGAGWFFAVFLIVWVTLWTFGGLAAIHEWLRLIAGEDRVTWDGTGVERISRAGPIRRRRSWSRDEIERISTAGRARSLMLPTGREAHVLTAWGTLAEREALRDDLRRALGTSARRHAELPAGWSSEAAGSAWLSHGGTDYLVRQGAISKRGWFVNRRWSVTLEPVSLRVTRSTDSDGDEWQLGAANTRIAPPAVSLVVRAVDLEPARALGDAAHPTHRLYPPLRVARVQGEPAIELEVLVARDRIRREPYELELLPPVLVSRGRTAGEQPLRERDPPVLPCEPGGGTTLREFPPQDVAELVVGDAQDEQRVAAPLIQGTTHRAPQSFEAACAAAERLAHERRVRPPPDHHRHRFGIDRRVPAGRILHPVRRLGR